MCGPAISVSGPSETRPSRSVILATSRAAPLPFVTCSCTARWPSGTPELVSLAVVYVSPTTGSGRLEVDTVSSVGALAMVNPATVAAAGAKVELPAKDAISG